MIPEQRATPRSLHDHHVEAWRARRGLPLAPDELLLDQKAEFERIADRLIIQGVRAVMATEITLDLVLGRGQFARTEQPDDSIPNPGWSLPAPITPAEWAAAHPAPVCIVEDYLFADVAVLVAPGGTGKTTLLLYEAIHVALGRPLYGLQVLAPGPVVIVTGEDTREMLVARLRMLAEALGLTPEELAVVMSDVRISDVSGRGFKLTTVTGDTVLPAPIVDILTDECQRLAPVMVTIDPAVSFGVGEARVNDAEQGLIEAARRIRGNLGCCVRYIHHVGKVNAREKALDQYAGRGGSAFADGARMVAVLQPLTPEEWRSATGWPLPPEDNGLVLARPKLSFCAPQPDILLARHGYTYTHARRIETDNATRLNANCDQIITLLEHDLAAGTRHSRASLEALKVMPRNALRDAIAVLIARGRLQDARYEESRKGGAQTYLQPTQGSPQVYGEPTRRAA